MKNKLSNYSNQNCKPNKERRWSAKVLRSSLYVNDSFLTSVRRLSRHLHISKYRTEETEVYPQSIEFKWTTKFPWVIKYKVSCDSDSPRFPQNSMAAGFPSVRSRTNLLNCVLVIQIRKKEIVSDLFKVHKQKPYGEIIIVDDFSW